jgi:CheY-like chemotaxis protein
MKVPLETRTSEIYNSSRKVVTVLTIKLIIFGVRKFKQMTMDVSKKTLLNKNGPIIIIEDDADDKEFLEEIFRNLNYSNRVIFFSDGDHALVHLETTDDLPFLILSDINMPKLNGFALRDKLKTDSKLSNKCIPYLFFSTAADQKAVIDAYSQSVQGFFIKPNTMTELQMTIGAIMEYWRRCAAPNDFPE